MTPAVPVPVELASGICGPFPHSYEIKDSPLRKGVILLMSDNPAFVLKGVEDVVYEQRPVPERQWVRPYVKWRPLKLNKHCSKR